MVRAVTQRHTAGTWWHFSPSQSCHPRDVGSPLCSQLLSLLFSGRVPPSFSFLSVPALTPMPTPHTHLGVVVNEGSAAHAATIVARSQHHGDVSSDLGHAHRHLHRGLSSCRRKEGGSSLWAMQGESRRRKRAGLGPWGKQGVQKRQASRLNPAPGPRSLAAHPQGLPGPRALWPHTRSQSQLPGACPWAWPGARGSPPPGAHCWSGRGIRHWSPGPQSLRGRSHHISRHLPIPL